MCLKSLICLQNKVRNNRALQLPYPWSSVFITIGVDHFKGGRFICTPPVELVYLLGVLWAITNGNSNTYDLAALTGDLCGFHDDHIHSCDLNDSAEFTLELIAWVKSELR